MSNKTNTGTNPCGLIVIFPFSELFNYKVLDNTYNRSTNHHTHNKRKRKLLKKHSASGFANASGYKEEKDKYSPFIELNEFYDALLQFWTIKRIVSLKIKQRTKESVQEKIKNGVLKKDICAEFGISEHLLRSIKIR